MHEGINCGIFLDYVLTGFRFYSIFKDVSEMDSR